MINVSIVLGLRYNAADPCWWEDWHCGAIAHYSFLHHLRAGSLGAYDFTTWDLSYPEYQRWSINFFAFNSSDLSGPLISTEKDDEVSDFIYSNSSSIRALVQAGCFALLKNQIHAITSLLSVSA